MDFRAFASRVGWNCALTDLTDKRRWVYKSNGLKILSEVRMLAQTASHNKTGISLKGGC